MVKAMPPAEVPHSLRRTRSSSSRKLTPPEARALYRELDRDEGFRRATLEGWEVARFPSADPRAAASVLFLERSEGWESQAQGFLTEIELNEAPHGDPEAGGAPGRGPIRRGNITKTR